MDQESNPNERGTLTGEHLRGQSVRWRHFELEANEQEMWARLYIPGEDLVLQCYKSGYCNLPANLRSTAVIGFRSKWRAVSGTRIWPLRG